MLSGERSWSWANKQTGVVFVAAVNLEQLRAFQPKQ